jgi:hypothetical protein
MDDVILERRLTRLEVLVAISLLLNGANVALGILT